MTMPSDNLPEPDLEQHYESHFCPNHAYLNDYDLSDDRLDDPDDTCDDCIRISAECPLCAAFIATMNDPPPPHFETDLELHYDTHYCDRHADHDCSDDAAHTLDIDPDDDPHSCADCKSIPETCPTCREYLYSPPNAPFPD